MVGEHTADAIVVGGGIHGCSAALHLAQRGLRVILHEKDHVGRHASGVNAGGVRRLGRDLAEIPIAQVAWEMWQNMPALVDDDCGYQPSRHLKVARSRQELEQAQQRVAELNRHGFTHEEVIDAEQLRALLPAAAGNCLGALHVEGDGAAQPYRTTHAFYRRALRLGVRVFEDSPVETITRQGSDWQVQTGTGMFAAPIIVNAAGAWAGRLAAEVGDPVPLQAHAPMLAITAPIPAFVTPVVGTLGAPLSFKQYVNGTVLIGGGVRGNAYPETNRTELNIKGLASFLRTAWEVFPIMEKATIVRCWAGIEAYTPDNLPVIGRGREPGIVHIFGFSAHGFQLAPAVGAIAADLAQDIEPELPLTPFRVDRFNM